MRAMIMKEFRELRRDHRTMGMLIGMPILLLIVFGYAANFSVETIPTATLGPQAQQAATLVTEVPQAPFDVTLIDTDGDAATAQELLQRNDVDVAIDTSQQPPVAYVDGSSLFTAQTAVATFNRLGDRVTVDVLFNPDLKTSWVMVPAIIGLILTFIGTIVTSIGMVKEKQTGTIEQLAVMPIKPSTVILGKILPYFLLATLDMVLVTLLGMLLFDVPFNGNVAVFALGAGLFLFVVLGLGVFISTISQNVGQAIQTAFFFLLPQILLSGFIFPLEAIPWGVRWISYGLPLTYFTMVSQGVMLRGAPLDALWFPLLMLAIMAVIVFSGAVLRFRRNLAPGDGRRAQVQGRSMSVRDLTVRFGDVVGTRRRVVGDAQWPHHRRRGRGRSGQDHAAQGDGRPGADHVRHGGHSTKAEDGLHAARRRQLGRPQRR